MTIGTWVNPDVAIHHAQWCSPFFSVAVTLWVRSWLLGEIKVPNKISSDDELLDRLDDATFSQSLLIRKNENVLALEPTISEHAPDDLKRPGFESLQAAVFTRELPASHDADDPIRMSQRCE